MLNRRAVSWSSAVAIGVWLLPAVAVGSANSDHTTPQTRRITNHKVSETHKFARIGTRTAAGLVDGWIGVRSVHGAFRSQSQQTGASSEIVRGTEFDARGSRSFVFHNKVEVSNGQVNGGGSGRWTGGTGAYRHARGSFTISGGGLIGGVQTSHLRGSISY